MLSRRLTLAVGFTGLAALASRGASAHAIGPGTAVASDLKYPFTLPPLPYAATANERAIDPQTMELHHGKHHAAYVANLNAALRDNQVVAGMTLSAMLSKLDELPDGIRATIRNNAGGHALHSMFWTVMGGRGGMPGEAVGAAIKRDFGSLDQLKEAFGRAGLTQFGSGWALVLVDPQGKLSIASRPNQDSPLMTRQRVLFGNDVWEHAYYLKYQNRRADYLAAWWNVLDWAVIEDRFRANDTGALVV